MRRLTIYSITFAVLVLIVFNVQGWLVLTQTRKALEEELENRLENIASILALRLKGWENSREIIPVLTETMNSSNLLNISLIDESLRFLVNLRDPQGVGQHSPLIELDAPEIQSAFAGVPASTRLYTAGSAYLKSAYAPVYDLNGIPRAVLGVEADARFFHTLSTYHRNLLFINAMSLIAMLAIVITGITLNRYTLKLQENVNRTATFALLGEMSASLAHDMRNPLATILAAADNLRIRYNLADDKTFGYIQEQIVRLNEILNNYLSIGIGQPDPTEPVCIQEVIQEIVRMLNNEINKYKIPTEIILNGLPPISGIRQQLQRLFTNLLLNAIQAQPRGGMIRISGEVQQTGKHKWIVLKITDQGPGIPAKYRRKVFEPFFTTKEKGSGLGLFIAKKIVELHNGRISISSKTGTGTTVEVKLPAYENSAR